MVRRPVDLKRFLRVHDVEGKIEQSNWKWRIVAGLRYFVHAEKVEKNRLKWEIVGETKCSHFVRKKSGNPHEMGIEFLATDQKVVGSNPVARIPRKMA